MFGALLGGVVWILFFLVVGMRFFAIFDPEVVESITVLLTWVQVPVIAMALLTVYESGIPGGIGELRSVIDWIRTHDPDVDMDYTAMPGNAVLVGVELAAVTLSGVGLSLCTVFSVAISVAVVGAFGHGIIEPTDISIAGITPSGGFSLFLAGAVLWQLAMFVEASNLV